MIIFQSTLPAGGATTRRYFELERVRISIHAPRRGSDGERTKVSWARYIFQSTLPAGGATPFGDYNLPYSVNFNPRSPQGERQLNFWRFVWWFVISIHAPRRGSDQSWATTIAPAGISIHAPRRGSDTKIIKINRDSTNFNPRSPQGERP